MAITQNQVCLVCRHQQKTLFSYRSYTYFRCPECGLVSTYPIPSQTDIIAHYQAKFRQGNYALSRRYQTTYALLCRNMAQRLAKFLTTQKQSLNHQTLLDIGTFTGEFLKAAHQYGADVYGTELQPEAVAIANQKFPGKIIQADVQSRRFPHRQFDIITIQAVIEHVPNPDQLIRRCQKLLKPGGYLMLETPNSHSLLARSLGRFWPPYAPIEHIHLFSVESLSRLLTQNGFSVIMVDRHVKRLPVSYVYQNMQHFGPEFHRLLSPIAPLITKLPYTLPFYIGEMIIFARKTAT